MADQIRMKIWVNGGMVNYDGIAIRFPRNVGVAYSSSIFWNGTEGFEPCTWRVIKHYLQLSTVFVDVGSNIGLYSVLALKVNPNLRVFSYEPVPSIYEKNIAFHDSNGCGTGNIVNVAIGDKEGRAELLLPISDDGIEEETTATLRRDSWQSRKKCQRLGVAVTTLDQAFAEVGSGDRLLIKIDVEDFEANVFRGAAKLMQSVKPVFVCEILPREHGNQETYEVISSQGYIPFGITCAGLVRFGRNDFLGKREFTDFLIIPESMAPKVNYLHYSMLLSIQ